MKNRAPVPIRPRLVAVLLTAVAAATFGDVPIRAATLHGAVPERGTRLLQDVGAWGPRPHLDPRPAQTPSDHIRRRAPAPGAPRPAERAGSGETVDGLADAPGSFESDGRTDASPGAAVAAPPLFDPTGAVEVLASFHRDRFARAGRLSCRTRAPPLS